MYLWSVVTVTLLQPQITAILRSAVLVQSMLIFFLNLTLSTKCSDIGLSSWSSQSRVAFFQTWQWGMWEGLTSECSRFGIHPLIHIKASTKLMRFWKYLFSSQPKQRKIISPTQGFCFHQVHTEAFNFHSLENEYFLMRFRPSSALTRPKRLTD